MYTGSYRLKSDNPDPHPDWSERQTVLWGARALLVIFIVGSIRFMPLAVGNGFIMLLLMLLGITFIFIMTAIELRRIRVTKAKEGKDTQHAPPAGRGEAPRP